MGDMIDGFRDLKEIRKRENKDKQEWAKSEIEKFCNKYGFTWSVVNEWQYRVSSEFYLIDIFPQHNKYHIIKPNNKRGRYEYLYQFLKNKFVHYN